MRYYYILAIVMLSGIRTFAQEDLNKTDKIRATGAVILEQPVNDDRIKNRQHERVPSLVTSQDGKVIYVVWYSGGKEEGPGNYATLAVSTDGGQTWKNDQLVVFPKEPSTRVYDAALWRDKSGQVWLFYAIALNNAYWDLRGGVNAIPIAWNGKKVSHGKSRLISYGIMMNKPVYVPQKDFALFPVSVWKLNKEAPQQPNYVPDGTFIHRFDYKGKKKKELSALIPYSSVKMADSARTFDEHMVVQTSDSGDMLCMVRGDKRTLYYARSSDFGATWSALVPFKLTGGPTTSSRFYLGKLQSGNLLLVMNDNRNRLDMTAFLSKDGGKTWPHKLLIDKRDWVSYPDVDQTPDGTIHLTYDRERSDAKDILYCNFKEEDIVQGNTGNIVRVRVNPK